MLRRSQRRIRKRTRMGDLGIVRISIIGSGFVGQAIGKGFLELGNEIVFYDRVKKDLPNFTTSLYYAIANSVVSFICVPTPTDKKGWIDLSILKELSQEIGAALGAFRKKGYHTVIIKSTVVPTTTEEVVIPEIELFSSLKAGSDFGVCVNPEFMTEISYTWSEDIEMNKNFFMEDRIVIGELDKKSGDALEELYKPLNKPIFRTDIKTAEMIKYTSNCMLAAKISFWNEIFLVCKELGVKSEVVADIVALDPRIGRYGSVHGLAFGGKCLPKDLKAFISFAKKTRKVKLLKAVDEINEEMKKKYGVRE